MFAFHSSIAIPFVVQIAAVSEKNGTTVISISHLEVDMEVNPFLATVSQVLRSSVADPGSGAFLTPGPGSRLLQKKV
jgi:hypothetical protein